MNPDELMTRLSKFEWSPMCAGGWRLIFKVASFQVTEGLSRLRTWSLINLVHP